MAKKESQNNKKYLFRFSEAKVGYTEIASKKNAPLDRLKVSRLRLERNSKSFTLNSENTEMLISILVGKCSIKIANSLGQKKFAQIGERNDVFSEASESLLISPKTSCTITSLSKTVDIIVSQVEVNLPPYSPSLIKKADVDIRQIGEAHYQREVRVILGGEGPARELRAGETINGKGLWSSWPHHSFDKSRHLYPEFEEVFLYFIKPKESYALQRIDGVFCNGQEVDEGCIVKNGDWAIMPLGDHPVVSGPDSQVFYYWVYISPIPKIYSKWAEDQGGYA